MVVFFIVIFAVIIFSWATSKSSPGESSPRETPAGEDALHQLPMPLMSSDDDIVSIVEDLETDENVERIYKAVFSTAHGDLIGYYMKKNKCTRVEAMREAIRDRVYDERYK